MEAAGEGLEVVDEDDNEEDHEPPCGPRGRRDHLEGLVGNPRKG